MAALTTNDKILGNGLKFNVRSGLWEKEIDFAVAELNATDYFALGAIPNGFIPRNLAIVQTGKTNVSGTINVYKKSDGSAALATATLGTADKVFANAEFTAAGETLVVKLGAAFTKGAVKVVVSGDQMTGVWDEAERPVSPADTVAKNVIDEPTAA